MRKSFNARRMYDPRVLSIVSLLCLRVAFSVTVSPRVSSSDDREAGGGNAAAAEDYHSGREHLYDVGGSETAVNGGSGGRFRTVKDDDEYRVRNVVSEHEIPKEIPTRLKIVGNLATPPPDANIKLGFVPKQTYVQVRRYDTEVHLPRSAALAEARTAEEAENAPRLREIVSHTKKQEVYEEQGYEDAAYDHGGYKKAGEHHEKKIIPGEHKTDYVRTIDQSTEQAEVVNFSDGPYSTTTDSSQSATTTAGQQHIGRRKRPKSQRGAWARHRQSTTKNDTRPDRALANRRRRLKGAKNATDENRLMQESKYYTTRKYMTELDIRPTTYRPPHSMSHVSGRKKVEPKPFKPPKVSKEGYKFEYPFENFKDFSEIKTSTYTSPTTPKLEINSLYLTPPKYQVHETIKYGESRDVGKVYSAGFVKPELNYRRKVKNFPYELISHKKPGREEKKKYEKRVKFNFPYKIVEPGRKQAKFNRKKSQSIFGEPDTSPWIPITPKEVYDIHGYDSPRAPSEVKVREEEPVLEPKLTKKFIPIRVYDTPQTVSTSYTIQHVYKPERRPNKPVYPVYDTPHYQFDTPDTAESIKLNTFGDITPAGEFLRDSAVLSATSTSTAAPAASNAAHPYDIIAAHTSNLRASLQDRANNNSEHLVSDSESNNFTAATPANRESVEDLKDIETLSSNRYAIFQRVNFTMPIESTTASLRDVNDEFNKMFLDERDKFLFRHPHLSRETSRFIKTQLQPEETLKNITTKRDIVMTSLKNGNITHLTKVSKRNDVYAKPVLVYPQDYASSAKYVERLTLAHFSLPENAGYNPLPLDYHNRVASLTNHLNGAAKRSKRNAAQHEELVSVLIGGTTTAIPVNVRKYPFYKKVPKHGLSKYSVLRYVSNPQEIPTKRAGQMAFYESRNRVQCSEPTPPEHVVPDRENGDWSFNPQPKLPRIQLGDKISCLKMKFFGSDPLDNPFFKEESIGFPEVFDEKATRAAAAADGLEEDAESRRRDHKAVPKRAAARPRRKKKKKRNSEQFKRSTTVDDPFTKSSIRRWIDSLAKPRYAADDGIAELPKMYKRSARERPGNERLQKIIFVGGFINREDLNRDVVKPISTELPYTTPGLTDLNELKFNRFAAYPDVQLTTDAKKVNDFNEEFTFTPQPATSTATSAEELLEEDDFAYMTDAFQEISKVKTDANSSQPSSVEDKTEDERRYLPSASRIVTKSKSNKKYVDALSSLRNLQSSLRGKPNVTAEEVTYKPRYKEPTWRTKKPIATALPSAEVDSLLYVIHPKTGEGKWMKLLKVEEVDENDNDAKADSVGSGNDETITTSRYPGDPATYDDESYSSERRQPCREELDEKKPLTPEYDVYHISGLLKQVAPLKASETEINGLQTTEEQQLEDEDHESDSYFDLDNVHSSTHQFPEPHERLYYYVVDDDADEDGNDE